MLSGEQSDKVLQGIEERLRAIAEECEGQTDLLIALRHVVDADTAELRARPDSELEQRE